MFSNLQAAIALSTRAQNVFYKLVGPLWLGYYHIYGRLPCSLHMHKTRLQTVIETRQKRCHFFIHGRLRHSLHMHKTLYKKKCVGRKMRRRREKNEIQELKRQFLVLKTWKIYQNTVKNSSKIAPKARKCLGYFGDFWRKHVFASETPPCSTPFSNKGGGVFASENMLRKNPAEGRKILWFWCLKSLGERYGNAWFLQRKSCFLSV